MEFPKQVMSAKELMELGIPKSYLYQIPHRKGQKIAWKNPGGRKWFFDTEKLQKAIQGEMRT